MLCGGLKCMFKNNDDASIYVKNEDENQTFQTHLNVMKCFNKNSVPKYFASTYI
jgi:hypothetical protein